MDLQKKIVKQFEVFLSKLHNTSSGVPFAVFLTFNRLKSLTQDSQVLKEALEKGGEDTFEVRDDAVRRTKRFELVENEDIFDKYIDETLYLKGFNSDATLENLENWFKEMNHEPKSIHMRKFPRDKKFKGSIFATFGSHEAADAFLNCKEGEKYGNNCVIRMWQKDYKAQKAEEIGAREDEKKKRQELNEKSQLKEVEKIMVKNALLELSNMPEKAIKAGGKRDHDNDDDDAKEPKQTQLMEFKTVISEKLGEMAKGLWLDVQPEENKVVLRFKTAEAAVNAENKLKESGLVYKERELIPRIIQGQEETEYWLKYMKAKSGRSNHKRNQGHGKRHRRT
ncbi:hypothetical protein Ciccas_006276 [Cichlidogyrus casuarinus]|uniref:Uncharacterized protein n=1 Tax=Cichlidogyrus casuarinus TaxID=1844966 RepID=A0ABD2Q6K6_9PLAT